MANKTALSLQLFVLAAITVGLRCDFPNASILENGNIHLSKREMDNFHGPYIVNQNRTVAYLKLVVVVDNAMYNRLERNTTKVNKRYKNMVNFVNSFGVAFTLVDLTINFSGKINTFVSNWLRKLFQEYNVGLYVALIDIVIYADMDEIRVSMNIISTYDQFKSYVRKMYSKYANNPMKNNHIDRVILMSGISFNQVYTKSESNQPCELSSGVIEDYNREEDFVARFLSQVLTEQMGVDEACSVIASYEVLKNCTVRNLPQITENIKKFKCFDDKPIRILNAAMCGNGFIERGEQCDCGSVEECENPCCNATTCMFKAKAFYAMGECCDLKACRLRAVSALCRPKSQDCDLPEYCDGQSEFCPDDVFKIIGTSCTEGSKCDLEKHKCKGEAVQCEEIHCNDNGVCNSKGHCHCNDGFAPPTCENAGMVMLVITMSYTILKIFPLTLGQYESYRNFHTADNPARTVPSSLIGSTKIVGGMQYNESGDLILVR